MKTIVINLAIIMSLAAAGGSATAQEVTTLEQPILISSAGQSADTKLVEMLAKKQNLEFKTVSMAGAGDLDGIKTMIIVPGFSSKGLGAAGISQQQEMDRATALLKAAGEKGIPIVTVHIGGKARRGAQSDDFNRMAAEASVRLLVVAQGDEDKFFSNIATEKKIPIEVVEKIAAVAAPLGELFQQAKP
jgi:hypothetical protein